jgi:hypothetical protein
VIFVRPASQGGDKEGSPFFWRNPQLVLHRGAELSSRSTGSISSSGSLEALLNLPNTNRVLVAVHRRKVGCQRMFCVSTNSNHFFMWHGALKIKFEPGCQRNPKFDVSILHPIPNEAQTDLRLSSPRLIKIVFNEENKSNTEELVSNNEYIHACTGVHCHKLMHLLTAYTFSCRVRINSPAQHLSTHYNSASPHNM